MELNIDIYRDRIGEFLTLGKLYLEDIYYCEVLEDTVRLEKVYGETAIPFNEEGYKVGIRKSSRFGRDMVCLYTDIDEGIYYLRHGGMEFVGVLFHGGNTVKDTEGCLICAKDRSVYSVHGCKEKLDGLYIWVKKHLGHGDVIKCRIYNRGK